MPADLVKSRIAVTGFRGFIGSCFVDQLRSLNIPVICLEGDVRLRDTWKEDFDVVYHFAAMMPGKFKDTPEGAFSVNINGVYQALEACRRNKAHMVFPSTCGVYKPDTRQSFSEEDPLEPPTAYTQSKFIGEMLCRSYAQYYGVKTTVLRLFNVYGPGQARDYIIPYLIKCGCEERIAEVYHPESSRDFIHIKDVVDVLLRAAKIKELFSVYNVGSGESHTVAQVIELIGQVGKKKIQYKKIESPKDPQPFVRANIAKAVNDLGWPVKVSLKDGILGIINNFHQGEK